MRQCLVAVDTTGEKRCVYASRSGVTAWPRSFAAETALELGSEIDLALVDGRLIITPIAEPAYRLDDLLARITPENLHGEADTGPGIGAEAW